MFTSRAEYRILLRNDNADARLTPYAEKFGLASEQRSKLFHEKMAYVDKIIRFCKEYAVKPVAINDFLEKVGTAPLQRGCKLFDLINRPQLNLQNLAEAIPDFGAFIAATNIAHKDEAIEAAEIEMKYHGYIARERALADKMQRLENIKIRGHFNYNEITQLSTEARQKLTAIDPETLAQAERIPGVSPSDISVLLVLMGR